jgi:hypothetical protein
LLRTHEVQVIEKESAGNLNTTKQRVFEVQLTEKKRMKSQHNSLSEMIPKLHEA